MNHIFVAPLALFVLASCSMQETSEPVSDPSANGAAAPERQAPTADEEPSSKRPFDLLVGDAAPALHADEWLTGESTELERGKVYLVHFWATWSPPSLLNFATMTETQKQYAEQGLVVLGFTREDDRGNRIFAIKETVEENAENIGYALAWDQAGLTYDRYMGAAGFNKIPHAFLIDRSGRIAFMGHPGALEDTLGQVLEGTFDVDQAAADYLADIREREVRAEIETRLSEAYSEGKYGDVLLALDELIALGPEFRNYAVNKFQLMMREMKDPESAYSWALEAKETCLAEDWYALNTIAYSIVIMRDIEPKNFDVALELAEKARTVTEGKQGQVWNTIGAIQNARGELELAISAMEKAVELTDIANQKDSFARTLSTYRKQLESK